MHQGSLVVERGRELVAGAAEEVEPRLPLGRVGGGDPLRRQEALALVFGALPLADVPKEDLRIDRLPARVTRGRRLLPDPHDATVSRDQPVFGSQGRSVLAAFELVQHPGAVLRVEELREEVRRLGPLARGVARQLVDQGADVERRAAIVGLGEPRNEREAVDERPVTRLGPVELVLPAALDATRPLSQEDEDAGSRRADRHGGHDPRGLVSEQDQQDAGRGH